MSLTLKSVLTFIAKPFIEKKLHEYQSTNELNIPTPHPAQLSSQFGKIGAASSITLLTQADSLETTIACIVGLLINVFFIYKPESLSFKKS